MNCFNFFYADKTSFFLKKFQLIIYFYFPIPFCGLEVTVGGDLFAGSNSGHFRSSSQKAFWSSIFPSTANLCCGLSKLDARQRHQRPHWCRLLPKRLSSPVEGEVRCSRIGKEGQVPPHQGPMEGGVVATEPRCAAVEKRGTQVRHCS